MQRHPSAEFGNEPLLNTIHLCELCLRAQTRSNADQVDVDGFFRAGNGLPFFIELRDHRSGDRFTAVRCFCPDDGMTQIKRHTSAADLCGVDAITTDLRRSLHNTDDVRARLHQLVTDDQADITGADHQNPLAGQHSVNVDHCLRAASAHYAREGPPLKVDGIFLTACADQDPLGMDRTDLLLIPDCPDHRKVVALVQTDDRAAEPDLNTGFRCLLQELLADIHAADACIVRFGTKKFMDLLEQLTAGSGILINQKDLCPGVRSFDCRSQSGRTAADDCYLAIFYHCVSPLYSLFCVSMTIPSATGVIQVRTFRWPLTIMTQSVHWPIPQNAPRASCFLSVYRFTRIPFASSAAAIIDPALTCSGRPSTVMLTIC